MRRVLLTGASGFIGSNLLDGLAGTCELLAPTRAELDLHDAAAVRRYLDRKPIDVVLHCANEVRMIERIVPNNLLSFVNLSRCADSVGRIYVFGSGAEFGRDHWRAGLRETDFDAHVPVGDDYGFSKYLIAREVERSRNIVNLRLFGVFGPHEDWQRRFISNACCRAIWDLPITVHRNARFDYLWIGDLVRVVRWFVDHEPSEKSYNVCTGTLVDLVTLAAKVRTASGKALQIEVGSGSGPDYGGDNRRLLDALGGFEFSDLDAKIAELYAWYDARRGTIPREALA